MSLINDALKRASQTSKDRPTHAEVPAAMQPAQELPPSKAKLLFAAGPVVVVVLALGSWFLLQRFYQGHVQPVRLPATVVLRPAVPPQASQPRPAVNAAVVKQTAPPATSPARPATANPPASGVAVRTAPIPVAATPVRTATPQASPPNVVASTAAPVVAAPRTAPAPAPVAADPPYSAHTPVAFPKLQVKGIFYNKNKPYALINGDTVGEGERVLGVRVVKIEPNRVTLELNGRFKQLVFGE